MNNNNKKAIFGIGLLIVVALVIGYLFSNLDEEAIKEDVKPARVFEGISNEPVYADCSVLGSDWIAFLKEETGFSFCYKKEWGEPEIVLTSVSEQCRQGNSWSIKFPNDDKYDVPLIEYLDYNFRYTCDGDTRPFCWSCIDWNADQLEQTRLFKYQEGSTFIDKLIVDKKSVLRIRRNEIDLEGNTNEVIGYYLLGAALSGDGNIAVTGDSSIEGDVSAVAENMRFFFTY